MNFDEVIHILKHYNYKEADRLFKEGGLHRPQRRQIFRALRSGRRDAGYRIARILKEPMPEIQASQQPTASTQGRIVELPPEKPKRSREWLWIVIPIAAGVIVGALIAWFAGQDILKLIGVLK